MRMNDANDFFGFAPESHDFSLACETTNLSLS
jgi:hypothetical protein